MSFFRRIFSKKSEEDYETILSNLADDIQKRQLKLSEIRLRERRSTLLVTLYTLAAWVAYVSLWYLNALPDLKTRSYVSNPSVERVLKGLPVIISPIIILFVRRVVQIWYMKKGDAEEKTVKELMKRRRDKVEEIKKKTNYYSTRDLIQKYDEASPLATPLRQRFPPGQAVPQTPQALTPAQPLPPPRKQWYDKLADALLGEDDPNIASPSSRYALICEKCFAHNGLVKESMWEDAQIDGILYSEYLCPKCGHFNASVRAKRERPRQGVSPTQSAASSPSHSADMSPQSHPQAQESPSQILKGATGSEPDPPTVCRSTLFFSSVDAPVFPALVKERPGAMAKELRSERMKIEELQAQLMNQATEGSEYKERAEAAEHALEAMKKNFEDVNFEKECLKVMLAENKTGIKKEKDKDAEVIIDPLSEMPRSEKSMETDEQDSEYIKVLEETFQKYYRKYRSLKEAKHQLQDTCRTLEEKMSDLDTKNQDLQKSLSSSLSAKASSTPPVGPEGTPSTMPSTPVHKDFNKFMSEFPKITHRPSYPQLRPVCQRGVDLKGYLASDSDSKINRVATNFLCLPGRLTWCSPNKDHALAVGPIHLFDPSQNAWSKKSIFRGLYGRSFHLFYPHKHWIFYAGFYKALNLRSRVSEGSSMPTGGIVSAQALAEATVITSGPLTAQEETTVTTMIASLYSDKILNVETLGLQCVGYDLKLHNAMKECFEARRRGEWAGHYPERAQASEPPKKKQKIT
ncbi:hypothetical protein BDZ97DRAFT_1755963 [Flammula alnicola]|nr:hypothetical protein BDZ97DRAFT_1755963 [Flammula alnicola]